MVNKKQKNNQKAAKDLFQQAAAPVTHAKKTSEYGKQLAEKQKVKELYGVREAQFRRFFELARKSKDATGANLLSLLERRLDNVIFRLKYAKTLVAARKMIVHGHVTVDGKRVYSPSILVSVGTVVALSEKMKARDVFIKNEIEVAFARSIRVPEWLEANKETWSGKVLRMPVRSDIQATINENFIVELYSK